MFQTAESPILYPNCRKCNAEAHPMTKWFRRICSTNCDRWLGQSAECAECWWSKVILREVPLRQACFFVSNSRRTTGRTNHPTVQLLECMTYAYIMNSHHVLIHPPSSALQQKKFTNWTTQHGAETRQRRPWEKDRPCGHEDAS